MENFLDPRTTHMAPVGTILILRLKKDWFGGLMEWQFLLMFSTIFMLLYWVVGMDGSDEFQKLLT